MRENISQSLEEERAKKEKVKLLEKLNIGSAQKANIILVALGLKPATDLSLFKNNDSEAVVEEALTKAGLVFADKGIGGEKQNKVAKISIARDEETLNRLLALSPSKDHEEYGRLMGYPETAVEAFVNKKLLDEPTERKLIAASGNIFPMKLSKDHWREEIEHLRTWNEAIKEYSLDTYEEAKGERVICSL